MTRSSWKPAPTSTGAGGAENWVALSNSSATRFITSWTAMPRTINAGGVARIRIL
jgi:hypothetical protein